ncbi:MAG: cytochrome c [Proteobacteria bacterium]|nr:cytochrome c [Pseudomonadota bacterium]
MNMPAAIRWVVRIFAGALALGLITFGWYATRPGPFAFAGGRPVALANYAGHPTGTPQDFKEADPIARGRYLAQAADCEACHTRPGGVPFAGGLGFKTPFGTLYSPNITPDTRTGIGAWSDADFLKAVHEGIGRGGKRLYPAFPYASYTYLTDEDVLAIKAFLFSLPPVESVAPASELTFPYNQRWLMKFWSALFNPQRRFAPLADHSAEWNRGAYLVEALGHCGDCHTPRNRLQALDNTNKFSGTVIEGWRAYNITADPATGVGAWSDSGLADYLARGHAAPHGTASGPMAQVVDLSLSRLTPGDIGAIVTYLRSIPAVVSTDLPAVRREAAPASAAQGVPATLDPRGKAIYAGDCASCHTWTGVNPLEARASLIGSRSVNDPSAVNVVQAILRGSQRPAVSGTMFMPAFGAAHNDGEIAAVANYVTARFGARASSVSETDVRALRAASAHAE